MFAAKSFVIGQHNGIIGVFHQIIKIHTTHRYIVSIRMDDCVGEFQVGERNQSREPTVPLRPLPSGKNIKVYTYLYKPKEGRVGKGLTPTASDAPTAQTVGSLHRRFPAPLADRTIRRSVSL